MRILAVDDDDVHLSLLELVLAEERGHYVSLARSADEALSRILGADAPFECFLLDIEMPGMNGIELCAKIRNLPDCAGIPILMLTRMSDRQNMEAAFSAGATDYVTKPINKFELSTRLKLANELLSQKQRIAAMGMEIQVARNELGSAGKIDLATAFPLQDVSGAIEYVAFENFLLRSSMETRNLDLLAVKVGNADEIFHTANGFEFSFVMHSVADEIAEVLKQRRFFLSYAGNGTFPLALRDGLGIDLEHFALELFALVPDLEFNLANGETVRPDLYIGSAVKAPFFARRANLRALAAAIANAEEGAARIKADRPLRFDGNSKKTSVAHSFM